MGNNFGVELHNRTISDITKIKVSSDQPHKINPFNINSIPAGTSYDIQLIKGNITTERILMGTAAIFVRLPPQYKVHITATFCNGAQDSCIIFLKTQDNSFIKMEKEIETHRISVQLMQGNEKMSITLEDTERQIENHEAHSLHYQANALITELRFSEASFKLDEALHKANEAHTIMMILACHSQLADAINASDQKSKIICDEGLKMLLENNYEEALDKFKQGLTFSQKDETISSIHNNITKTQEMKMCQEKCEKLVSAAEILLSQHKYQESLKLLKEALIFAKKEETILAITRKMTQVKEITKSPTKAEEPELLLNNRLYEEALKKFEEALSFAKKKQGVQATGNNVNKERTMKVNNHKAEEMKNEAETLLSDHKYEEALKLLEEARISATKQETILVITRNISLLKEIIRNHAKSEEIVKEAQSLLSSHMYEEAVKKFEAALSFTKKKQTIQVIENNINKARTLKRNEHKAEEMKKEAETLLSQHKYEEALKLLEEALKFAKKKETILVITRNMKQVKEITRSQAKSEEILKEAESLLSRHLYEEALKKLEAPLSFAKKKQTIQVIENNINKARTLKINEQKAEEMKKKADTLLDKHKYQQALKKLYQALKYTQKDTALIKESIKSVNVTKKKEQKAQELNEQGQTLSNKQCYDQGLQKFDEALKFSQNPDTTNLIKSNKTRTQQEMNNHYKAIKLNEEGLTLKQSKAVKKFTEALKLANEETLINTIKLNKASALNEHGETLLAEAWNAEKSSENRSAVTAQNLGQAKNLFMQANNTCPSMKYEENLKLVDAKIQGNRCYNAGVRLEREAATLIEKMESSSACREAMLKYISVKDNYANAMKKFKEGMKISDEKFKFSVGVVQEGLDGVEEIVNELEKCNLDYSIAEIKIKALKIRDEKIDKQCVRLNKNDLDC